MVRAFNPEATSASVAHPGGVVAMKRIDEGGLWEAEVPESDLPGYRLRFRTPAHEWEVDDPYRFLPTLGELDLHLIGEGTHRRLWERLGARVIDHQGVRGTAFSVWAPNARGVSLVSDSNAWDDRTQPMRTLGASGVWELFIPNVGAGQHYKFRVIGADGTAVLKADPLARAAEVPPGTASIVTDSAYEWADAQWMAQRQQGDRTTEPLNIYEVHLGSWRRGAGRRGARLPRDRAAAGRVLQAALVHACRAAAHRRAPLRWLMGLPGEQLLRADGALRHP